MSLELLKSRLDTIRDRIGVVRGRGEEATKQALVLPMLDALGFDIWNPGEVCPEFDADFAVRRGGPKERVDLALIIDNEPRVFIEVKAVDSDLTAHRGQLARYFNAVSTVSLAILTNGVEYQFFTDTGEPNIMDERPFHIFNLASYDVSTDVLARFHKSVLSPDGIRSYALDLIYTARLVTFLRDQLDLRKREPSDDMVRWILGTTAMYEGRLVSSVVDRFRPLVKNALQMVVRDIIRRSMVAIDSSIDGDPTPDEERSTPTSIETAPEPVQARETVETDESAPRREIQTTAEELQAFGIVQALFERNGLDKVDVFDVSQRKRVPVSLEYKDTLTYFGIYLNKVSWWCLRLSLESKTKWVGFPIEASALPPIPPDMEVLSHSMLASIRVRLNDVNDLRRLEAHILASLKSVIADH